MTYSFAFPPHMGCTGHGGWEEILAQIAKVREELGEMEAECRAGRVHEAGIELMDAIHALEGVARLYSGGREELLDGLRAEVVLKNDARGYYGDGWHAPSTASTSGQRLVDEMEARGLSKGDLAEMAGVSWSTVSRLCEGDRVGCVDTWMRLADALGVRLEQLVEGR